jgi:hypothetical protein
MRSYFIATGMAFGLLVVWAAASGMAVGLLAVWAAVVSFVA